LKLEEKILFESKKAVKLEKKRYSEILNQCQARIGKRGIKTESGTNTKTF
jgi:hypothetical protein